MFNTRVLILFVSAVGMAGMATTALAEKLPGKADLDTVVPQGPRNSASGAPANWPTITQDDKIYSYFLLDRLEYGVADGPDNYLWEGEGWIGGDYNKLWLKTEGEGPLHGGGPENIQFQAKYGRTISPFFSAQVGLRYDSNPTPTRGFAVFNLQGLAPEWFEVENQLYISEDGDVSFDGEYEYQLLLTQRLMLAPRVEVNLSAQDERRYGIGSGLSSTQMGLRLRYAIRREFAPYIGVRWDQKYGDTKDFARAAGEATSSTAFVVGVRAWY